APAPSPAPAPAPAPVQGIGNTNGTPPVLGANPNSHFQVGSITLSDGNDSKPAVNPDNSPAASAPAASDPPIAAPAKFKALDEQLNKMDSEPDEVEASEPASAVTKSVNTITKETRKIMKHITVPGVASVSAASIGYVLLIGRTMYSSLA